LAAQPPRVFLGIGKMLPAGKGPGGNNLRVYKGQSLETTKQMTSRSAQILLSFYVAVEQHVIRNEPQFDADQILNPVVA
jgi:hypothetical protein